MCRLVLFFFFASRRRHTRLVSDWSSDVCSSDLWTAFSLSQSAKAESTFTVAGINSTLPGWSQAAKTQESSQPRQQIAGDSAFSALTSFAQRIGAEQPKSVSGKTSQSSDRPFDHQTYAALRSFAQGMGNAQPESIKSQPKLADADNLLDFLRQGGSSAQPPAASKGPVAGGKHS